MKLITTLFSLLLMAQASAGLITPEGTYSCPITIEEHVDLVLQEGEDFPDFRGRFDPPRVRNEVLEVAFSNDGEAKAAIVNPVILPNFLFVTPKYYNDFSTFSWETEKSIVYQIDYPSWYFGATVQLETAAVSSDAKKIKLHITFDDNDGWATTLKWKSCTKN